MQRLLLVCVALAADACKPDLGQPPSLVAEPRLLAVRADPPEVRPGASATYTALEVGPDGTVAAPAIAWALCLEPKPLDENNVVAGACLGSGAMVAGNPGPTATLATPADACALFGPDPPPQMMGQAALRPRDPDSSGGYYQPIRLTDGALTAFSLERITCNLANAGATVATEFAMEYQPNSNPTLGPLTASVGGQPAPLTALPVGQAVDFTVSWPDGTAESYPVYDPATQALVPHRESLRVSWFATAGAFAHDVTGRGEDEMETSTDDLWTAPKTPGPVHLWLVLRDSRGGLDFASYDLEVTP